MVQHEYLRMSSYTTGKPVFIATRGSALALAQANFVLSRCREACPEMQFELKIIKTTGDKLQTASLAKEGETLPKGLFTKELEVALLAGEADLAVHSLKDLPTELPDGLQLTATPPREDVRDVLLFRRAGHPGGRGYQPHASLPDFAADAVIATSSTRRKAQLLEHQPGFQLPDIRGNVSTRLRKLAEQPGLDGTMLALAGLRRLGFEITPEGMLLGEAVPEGICASILPAEMMIPCVGQAAIGIETRAGDGRIEEMLRHLNHPDTLACVTAERAFLAQMGGGCQSPVAAYARIEGEEIRMSAASFTSKPSRRIEGAASRAEAAMLGRRLAEALKEG